MRRSSLRYPIFSSIAVVLAFASTVWAQPVPLRSPDSTHIFPAGARRGTKVRVHVGTECFPPGARLRFWGDGLQATKILETETHPRYAPSPRRRPTLTPISYPREWEAQVDVATDAAIGACFWRLSCAQGGSSARPFVIGDLPEFIESESNSTRQEAERVSLPVTVNGQIAGERDLDYYVFAARQGDVVVCDVLAGRLGSPLDPIVELRDADGRRLDTQQIRVGSDPVLSFRVPRDGDYLLLISNVTFHGGPKYVYRINLATDAYVYAAYPSGGQAGQTSAVDFLALSGTRKPRRIRRSVTFPVRPGTILKYRLSGEAARTVPLSVGDFPERSDGGENASQEKAQRLSLPVTVNGRFLASSEEDWYRFAATKFTKLILRCDRPAGSRARPVLAIVNAKGRTLKKANSFASEDGSCLIHWICPANGDYYLRLHDGGGGTGGGTDFIYRLTAASPRKDFELRLQSDFASILPGGKSTLSLNIVRRGGFAGPLALSIQGLPKGVRAAKTQVPGKASEFKLVLQADEDVRCDDAELRIEATAMIDGEKVRRAALAPHAGRDADGVSVGDATVDHLQLTVRHKPVFRLFCQEAYQYAHRGAVYAYGMEFERLGGYRGDIVLQIGDRQNRDLDGIEMLPITVPSPVLEAMMPIYLPETMHVNAQGQSQLYVQGYTRFTDRHGQRQSLLVVSEKRCLIRALPRLVKLSGPEELIAAPGQKVRCRFRLERANYDRAMTLALVKPPPGVTAEPISIRSQQNEAEVTIEFDGKIAINVGLSLTFRAVGSLPKHFRAVTEAKVLVRWLRGSR